MAAAGAAARPFDVVVFGATGYTVRASGSRAPVRGCRQCDCSCGRDEAAAGPGCG